MKSIPKDKFDTIIAVIDEMIIQARQEATEYERLKEISAGSLLALKSAYVFMKNIERQSTHNEYLLWGDDSREVLDRVNAAIAKATNPSAQGS